LLIVKRRNFSLNDRWRWRARALVLRPARKRKAQAKPGYRIEGRVRSAEWSLDTLPQRGDHAAEGQNVVVVGLFANFEQVRHFVPEGCNIHAHAVFPALGVAGHLKAFELEPGAPLQIQIR